VISHTPEPVINTLQQEIQNLSPYLGVEKGRQVPELHAITGASPADITTAAGLQQHFLASMYSHQQRQLQAAAELASSVTKTEDNRDEPELDVENVDQPDIQTTPTDLTAKSNPEDLRKLNESPECIAIDDAEDIHGADSGKNEIVDTDITDASSEALTKKENQKDDQTDSSNGIKEDKDELAEFAESPISETRRSRSSRSKNSSPELMSDAPTGSKITRPRSSRRRSSSPATSKTRGTKRTREAPRRGQRKRSTRFDTVEYNDSSDNETNMTPEPELEEELANVGSEEDEEDSPTADIKAAVQGLIEHDLSEDKISNHSKKDEENTSYSSEVVTEETSGSDGNNSYEMNHNEVIAAKKSVESQPKQTVPKIKLRLNNGPITVEENYCDYNGNGSV